jgi:FkbM family methyltransferase
MSGKLRYLYRAYRYRYYGDPAELRFVREHLKPGDVAADVGCYKGAYVYWMRRRVGPSGAVFAFEPQPRQVEYLRKMFSTMSYDNVSLVPMAVSNVCGQLPLHVPIGEGATHAASLEELSKGAAVSPERAVLLAQTKETIVNVTSLDAFFANQDRLPSFVKIDVEGHEMAVLEGAAHVLDAGRPALLIECESRHRADGDVRPVFELLQSHGYEGSFFLNRHRYPLAAFQASVHQKVDAITGMPPPQYVNNFAFVPRR